MMKALSLLSLTLCAAGLARAQMVVPAQPAGQGGAMPTAPSGFDASGSSVKPASNDPAHRGETPNPQLLGMEIPLLDPASDSVSYNGGRFDVGNNAAVRAMFEKYLQQTPDDSTESKRYRDLINRILKETQKSGRDGRYTIGSGSLVNIGLSLYEADKYPGDGGQSGMLASSIVSAIDVQRKNLQRDKQSARLMEEYNKHIERANQMQNASQYRKDGRSIGGGKKGAGGGGGAGDVNVLAIAQDVKQAAKKEALEAANTAANEAGLAASKVNYQSVLIALLMSRRFDHAVIGARVYRHVYKDGDTQLKMGKDSKASELFTGVAGMPPTVNAIDSLASNARREVDQSIQAVYNMLAQNKLGEATQHLIEAVAIGEYMQSVATFPMEARQRIARYWTLRKRALSALNARDYNTVEEIARKMKEMDEDFDDSLLLSYTAGKKRQSDLALRNAFKALKKGDEDAFNQYIQEAGIIWPLNPQLEQGAKQLVQYDEGDAEKEEFRRLLELKSYRRIAREKERFKIVNTDPELAKKYEEVITLVMRMDGMLEQIRSVAGQDTALGPCMAYEKMVQWQKENEDFAADSEMKEALHEFESLAHDFVQALRDAAACEERREFGSALSGYYRAQCKYPHSELAAQGIRRVTDIIVRASYN